MIGFGTMNEFVSSLAGNNEFVDMLAKQLGLERTNESKEEIRKKKEKQRMKNKPINDMLGREQRRLEGLGQEDEEVDRGDALAPRLGRLEAFVIEARGPAANLVEDDAG